MSIGVRPDDALLVVDPQCDFCPGGALAVPGGDAIFPTVNRIAPRFAHAVASRDWHPAGHASFAAQGGPWPPHCIQGTPGAEFHPDLDLAPIEKVVSKATGAGADAYSAFDGTGLAAWLRERGVRRLFVTGLATDYCVRASVLDARREGFEVVVVRDAVGAVELAPGDGERALEEMRAAGAELTTSDQVG